MSKLTLRLMTLFLLSMITLASCSKDNKEKNEPKPIEKIIIPNIFIKAEGNLEGLSGAIAQKSLEEVLKSYKGKTLEELTISGKELQQKDLDFIRTSFKAIEKLDLSHATLTLGSTEEGFKGNKNIKVLILPSNLEKVGFGQLGYTELKELVFSGNKLKSIGAGAFSLSKHLKTVKLPKSVEILDEEAFTAMSSLERIELPKEISVIPSRCFAFDPKLEEVVFKGTIRHLGANVFAGCPMLTKIKFTQSTAPRFNKDKWPFIEAEYFNNEDGTPRFHFYIPKGSLEEYLKVWGFTDKGDEAYFVEY